MYMSCALSCAFYRIGPTLYHLRIMEDYMRTFEYNFKQVAFVAIGATMVGSISFSKEKGDHVRKGDEVFDS